MIDTKKKILDTAERLFSEQGYDATSLRQIIAEAEVNLAAIHYHFGSKEELLDELVTRKAGPVNERRLAELDRLEADAGARLMDVEKVLEAFLMPMADGAGEHPRFARLMGRLHAEGILTDVVRRNFHPVLARFLPALRRALPELPEREFEWRVHFMMGAMAHTMCGSPQFVAGEPGAVDFRERVERLLAFLSGGFRAPVSRVEEQIEIGESK